MKIFRRVLAVALWALLLAPFFWGAQAAHPATDDFTFAAYTHPTWLATGSVLHVIKDAFSYALRTWRDWQGTVTGVVVMALGPAVFTLEHYGVHAVLLLALNLAAWGVFLRHVIRRRIGLRGVTLPVYLALSGMLLLFLPDMVEGIYWFNGAWFYMGAQAAALLALVLCDRFADAACTGAKKGLMAGACCLLLFALGMDNYITAMMTAAALLMMALMRAYACWQTPRQAVTGVQMDGGWEEHLHGGEAERLHARRAAIRTALLLIPIVCGLLLSVLAPGNAVRMAADGAHESGLAWASTAILWTLRDAAKYVARFLLKTPLLAGLCLMTPMVCRAMKKLPVRRDYATPPMAATLVGFYLILCAMIVPHMYASGNAGSGRVVNMYHCYVLVGGVVAWLLLLLRMKPETRGWLSDVPAKTGLCVIAALALAVCLMGGQLGSYMKLVRDQHDGTQDAYIAQFQNEYALCEAAGEGDEVVLPAWTVQTVTGKPTAYEDASVWTNASMARYFGVKSVQAAPAP